MHKRKLKRLKLAVGTAYTLGIVFTLIGFLLNWFTPRLSIFAAFIGSTFMGMMIQSRIIKSW